MDSHRGVFAGSEGKPLQQHNHGHFQAEKGKLHSNAVPGISSKRQENVGVHALSVLFTEPGSNQRKEETS